MILDTCFLIQLQREFQKQRPGPAIAFLELRKEIRFSISVVSVTEFLEGFADPETGERLLRHYDVLDIDSKVARQAALIRRHLRKSGELIGDFDILIAATALIADLPLVTKDLQHFQRIQGLEVMTY